LKLFAGLVVLAFAVTLAVIVGNRLSDEALGVLAGAVCGVGAAIPTSLIVVAVTRRQRQEPERSPQPQQQGYPPVVVVTPQGTSRSSGQWNSLPSSLSPPMERNFTVVGDEEAVNLERRRRGY
jgi:hypothetical protein